MKLVDHLFVSSTDGALYDTRVVDWHKLPPLRACYCMHKQTISSVAEFKAALRVGGYAWPGGYPLYFVLADGGALSFEAARSHFREILYDMVNGHNQWRVVGVEINYEDVDLCCEHSGERIPSAYVKENSQ